MDAVAEHAREGGPVVGICNGFQVLTEAGLLPGALQKNTGLRFLCDTVDVRVASTRSALTSGTAPGAVLRLPINHFEGNYTCDRRTLDQLRDDDRVVLRYADNPNGSLDDIAGICNEDRNVVGLMPHPERAIEALLGSDDGVVLLQSLLDAAATFRADRPQASRLLLPRGALKGLARDVGALEHVGGDAELAPGRVRDALRLAVGLGVGHEPGLERRQVDGTR